MTLKRIARLIFITVLAVIFITSCQFTPVGNNGKDIYDIELVAGTLDTQINIGDTLDTSGVQLKVTYTDKTTETVEADKLTVGAIDVGVGGVHKLLITYKGYSLYVDITVNAPPTPPTPVSITNVNGINTTLSIGDVFDTSAAKATVKYSDGSTKQVGVSDGLTVSNNVNTGVGGVYYVTVTYGSIVSNPVIVSVNTQFVGIEFDHTSFDTNLYHNDTFNASLIRAFAKFNDGTKALIASAELDVDDGQISTTTIGEFSFTISYTRDGSVYTVTVPYTVSKKLISISINGETVADSVLLGSTLDVSGLTVLATYSDGSTETVSAELLGISSIDTSISGTRTLTVSYLGESDTEEIEVLPVLVGIEYAGNALVFKHELGVPTDPEAADERFREYVRNGEIKLILTYNHGVSEYERVPYTLTPDSIFAYNGLDCSAIGDGKYIDINYGGFSADIEFSVTKYLASVSLSSDSGFVSRIAHNANEFDSLSALKLVANYSDGTSIDVPFAALEILGFSTSAVTPGATMTVSYTNEYGTASISVDYEIYKTVVGIELGDESYPTKYKPYSTVTMPETVTAKYVYSDSSYDIIVANLIPFELDTAVAGSTSTAQITYTDGDGVLYTAEFRVEVLTVKSLSLLGINTYLPSWISEDAPTDEYVAELLSLSSAKVKVVFSSIDGELSEEIITADALDITHNVDISSSGKNKYTVTAATANYGAASIKVTVGRSVQSIEILESTDTYFAGCNINLETLKIKVTYHDGYTATLLYKNIKNKTDRELSYEGFSSAAVGAGFTYTLTYTENGISASAQQTYDVIPAYNEETTDFIFNVDYLEITVGDSFVFTSYGTFVVNGENVVNTEGFVYSCGYNNSNPKQGVYNVVVSYKGITATMQLKVLSATSSGGGSNVTDKDN